MNLKNTLILIATVALAMPCQAAESDEVVAVLVGRTSHMTVPDAAVQKAIEVIKKQQLQHVDVKPTRHETPTSRTRSTDRVLILGGSEAIPM